MKKIFTFSLFLALSATNVLAQFTKLFDFNGNGEIISGTNPNGQFVSDGTFLYGMTQYGGANTQGTIFKIKPDGTEYAKLLDFGGTTNGSQPMGSLISDGTFLYGMTWTGGINNMGTIFKIKTDGTAYAKLLDFAGAINGCGPWGSLISDGTFLYGMTRIGGINNMGTLFKIKPDGTGFAKLLDFSGTSNGNYPPGSLISDGTFLYGTTGSGGINSMGTIFKIKPDGTGYSKLLDFAFSNGRYPNGSLISDGTYLYGMTEYGGTNNQGVIFKIMPNGTGFSDLFDFDSINGSKPMGSLISDGTFLYGMTKVGGINNLGTTFKIKPDGTGYNKLIDFTGEANGRSPEGSLISDGTFLYGMTHSGGTYDRGTLFKIMTNGTGYDKLLDLAGTAEGNYPLGNFISDGTFLYGMAMNGGTTGNGVVFKIKTDGTGYDNLLDFNGTVNGRMPFGPLISDGIFFYGMTLKGGISNTIGDGTIFKIKPDGSGYSKLIDFDGINGGYPIGALISDGTFLYGMTQYGGIVDSGTVFKIMPNGTGYAKLLDFSGTANGSYPSGSLISDGTFLYGITREGGTNSKGTIFKIKSDGTGYVKLLDFSGAANGSYPSGSLFSDGTFLYGMTQYGGTSNYGVIFKIKTDGTGYAKLLDFTGTTNGKCPYYGSLISDGSFLYGMTNRGGTNNDGTLFKIKPNGSSYVKLYDFDSINGRWPYGSLFSDGPFLYGMTVNGGTGTTCSNGCGVVFKYQFTDCIAHYTTIYDSVQNIFFLNVDSTTGAIAIGYHWSFGDGATSILSSPSHMFTQDTLYNVCMKIYTASGDSCVYCHVIGKDSLGNIIRNPGFALNVNNPNSTTGISPHLSDETKIAIYPNPTNGIFQILNTKYQVSSIEVYNVLGESIHKQIGVFSNLQIDLSNQPNGIYFLNIKTEQEIQSKILLINK